MEIHISAGEWIASLKNRMETAADGAVFYLPTTMHHHAFDCVKNAFFPERNFIAKLES